MSPLWIGTLGFLVLLLLLAASMPVAFAMALVGVVGFALVINPGAALGMITAEFFETFTSYGLSVIPLFVLMGQVAFHSGISARLYRAAYCWIGWVRGGLAMATVGACAAFGAICGSGPATAATMAAVALPEMRRYRYNMELAAGTVAAAGGLGMLIPPSVVFIVYGMLTQQSVQALFLAGIVPGILIAALFCLTIALRVYRNPQLAPTTPPIALRERVGSLLGVIDPLLLFLLVIGGLFAGWFTPTEAAAVGAAGSLVAAALRGQLTLKMLSRALTETLRTSCMVLIIVAGAVVFSRFLAVTRIPTEIARGLAALPLPGWGVMGMMILFYLLAGCFIDALALVMLTIPIFYPVVMALGFDPIWFGVVIVVVTQMGVISPPVGVNAYVVSGIERDVPLQSVFRGALPFLLALLLAAALLIAFPALALWLPGQAGRY